MYTFIQRLVGLIVSSYILFDGSNENDPSVMLNPLINQACHSAIGDIFPHKIYKN